ncbi:MAG: leucine-rich repeat protein [Oscillospiraceae bacterium]|nr:leucine-rich repeat protein [Oscillospiraceae bacterium]
MKIRNKKLIACVCALSLITGITPYCREIAENVSITASAETYEDLTYELVDENLDAVDDYVMITDCNDEVTNIEIPAEIDGLPVKVIGDSAFSYCYYLANITIPEGITKIGNSAFFKCCNKLQSIVIPDSVTEIGSFAFDECGNLSDVQLGSGLKTIGEEAFHNCDSLKKLIIPEGVESIGSRAFYGSKLTSVVLPESLKEMYSSSFMNTPLINAQSEEDIWYIHNWVIYGESAKKLETKEGTRGIANSAFSDRNIQYAKIGDGVDVIGDYAFYSCSSLETVEIADSVTKIGDYAFYENKHEIVLPAELTDLGTYALAESNITEIVTPDKLTEIKEYTFSNCDYLKKVTFGSGLEKIGDYSFSDCDTITELTFPENVTEIGWRAFEYCDNLEKITIDNPECVISDSEYTFGSTDSTMKIYGYTGSTAEAYAEKYNRIFVALDAPTEPSTDPTEPGTDPTEPGTDPTEPGTNPTEPGTDPTEPGTEPTEPGTEPTEPGTEPTEEYPVGDANCDGVVNVRDAAAIAKALAKGTTGTLPANADFNGDGDISVRDAAAIAAALAKGEL